MAACAQNPEVRKNKRRRAPVGRREPPSERTLVARARGRNRVDKLQSHRR